MKTNEGKSRLIPRVFVPLYGTEQPDPARQVGIGRGQAWPTKDAGKPTAANIEKFIVRYYKSTKPGGVNAHIGASSNGKGWPVQPPARAYVYDQTKGEIVGEWKAPSFWVIDESVTIPDRVLASIDAAANYLRKSMSLEEARAKSNQFKRDDCEVKTWFERDRAHVAIECGDDTVAEWWDDEVQDMADSGYFTMGKGDTALERSVLDYAVEMGLISEAAGLVTEETKNIELESAMTTIVSKANDLFKSGFVNGGAVLSIGVPVGKLAVHVRPRDQWTNGIFENGPALRVLIQNNGERPQGPVAILGRDEAPGGSTGRGDTYSVSFTSFATGFRPRVMNKAPLAKIVQHVLRTLQAFQSHAAPRAVGESRVFNNKAVFDAYVEAALWSSTQENGDPMDDDFGADDIAPSTLKSMKKDVDDFIKEVQRSKIDTTGWNAEQFGHDFWLSRNGHGAGFFDRGGAAARKLQDAARAYGEYDLYVGDDGKVYAVRESVNEAAMKMKPEHYKELVAALRDVKAKNPNINPKHYADNKIGKDPAMRFRWDAANVAKFADVEGGRFSAWMVAKIYDYMNDTHMDTALKKATGEVWGIGESVNEARGWNYERQGPGLLITAPDGRTCFLQGDDADALEDKLDTLKTQRQINMELDAYDEVCEATVTNASIAKDERAGKWFPAAEGSGSKPWFVMRWENPSKQQGQKVYRTGSGLVVRYQSLQSAGDVAAKLNSELADPPGTMTWPGMQESGSRSNAPIDVNAILEAKRKAKGIYRTGDHGVFFIANKDIDKGKAAKTDAKMAKKYGKDFAGLSAKDKLSRIKSVKMDKSRYGKRANWNESVDESTYRVYAKRLTSTYQYDSKIRLGAGDVVFFQDKELTKHVYYAMQSELPKNASKFTISDTPWNLKWVTEAMGEQEDDNYMPDGGTEASRAYYFIMHRARRDGLHTEKPSVMTFINSVSSRLDYDIGDAMDLCRYVLTLVLGDTPLPPTVLAVLGRGPIPAAVKKVTALPQWTVQIKSGGSSLSLPRAAAFCVLLLEDVNAAEECRQLADALAVLIRKTGNESTEQESTMSSVTDRALAEARKKTKGRNESVSTKKAVSEISTGARTFGFLLSDAPEDEKRKIAPEGFARVLPEQTVSRIDNFVTQMEEAGAGKMTKAELILLDRKRAKRERRGKGKATGAQRLASKRNAKKAQRAMLRGSTQRKATKTRMKRARLRGDK